MKSLKTNTQSPAHRHSNKTGTSKRWDRNEPGAQVKWGCEVPMKTNTNSKHLPQDTEPHSEVEGRGGGREKVREGGGRGRGKEGRGGWGNGVPTESRTLKMVTWLPIKAQATPLRRTSFPAGDIRITTNHKKQIWVCKDHRAESWWPHVWQKHQKDVECEESRH